MVVHVNGAGVGESLHRQRAVIVLKSVVLVPAEQQATGSRGCSSCCCSSGSRRELVRVGRWQNPNAVGGPGGLSGPTKDFPQGVRRQASAHHVTHVVVSEACRSERRRRWQGVAVRRALCRRKRRVVRLRGPASVASARGSDGGSMSQLRLRRWLPVVQVGVWGWLWRLGRALIWGQDGHASNLSRWRNWAGLWRLLDFWRRKRGRWWRGSSSRVAALRSFCDVSRFLSLGLLSLEQLS